MGCVSCSSQDEETQKDKTIEKLLRREQDVTSKIKKILFLGAGGSGKSTIFKQLKRIHGNGFTDTDKSTFLQHIHMQCINQMRLALEVLDEYIQDDTENGWLRINEKNYIEHNNDNNGDNDDDDDDEDGDDEKTQLVLSESGLEASDLLSNIHYTQTLNDEICAAIKCLWFEPAIQKMYQMRNITKIEDTSAYFWDALDRINTPNYIPDEADILLVRYRTTGATEEKYKMDKGSFSIIDVGGQKSERKKWIKCFDSVTAVIFVASLSCYDEVLFEDYSTNSMIDQLELFDDICNNEALKLVSMILFLNKKDLFAEKVKNVPLTKCPSFANFSGGDTTSFDQTSKYIRRCFISLNKTPSKNIFTHVTCATDQDNIQKVFADCQHIIIEHSLIQAGLMSTTDEGDDINQESVNVIEHDNVLSDFIRASIVKKNATNTPNLGKG